MLWLYIKIKFKLFKKIYLSFFMKIINRKTIKKTHKNESQFLEKINKLDKPLGRVIKKKREKKKQY